jgi:hypothetical protein
MNRSLTPPRRLNGICYLAALLLVLLSLFSHVRSGFLLDDLLHLERISISAGIHKLDYSIDLDELALHLPPIREPITITYFRPLTSLSIAIDHHFFGLWPVAYHLGNLLLHLLNGCLVFVLGRRLGLLPVPALATAVMWAVSLPAGLAAGWISGRSELLTTFFILAASYAALRYRQAHSRKWLLGASCLLGLAVLSKESGLVGPALIMILLLGNRGGAPANSGAPVLRISVLAALWVPVIVLVLLRLFLVGPPQLPEPYFQPPTSLAAIHTMALKEGLYLLGGMTGLPVLPFIQIEMLQSRWYATLLLVMAVAAGLWTLLRSVPRTAGLRPFCWFVVALLPGLWVMAVSIYLYLPLIGFAWLMGWGWQRSRFVRIWLGWLVAAGAATNLALGICAIDLGHRAEEAAAYVGDLLASGRITDLVLVDAPFWSYALPSSARLHDPSLTFRTHVINFSPFLQPAQGSTITWLGSHQCDITVSPRRLFASPLERFFLFGNDPCLDAREVSPFTFTCLGQDQDDPHPSSLRITLERSATATDLVLLQFDRWRLHRLLPRADTGTPAPPAQ